MLETIEKLRDEATDAEVDALIRLVGTRVRAARGDLGLSRRELSERSGVSPRYLAQLEGGEGNISIGLLKRIAVALDVTVDALVSEGHDTSVGELEIAALYARADERTRTRVRQFLDPERQRRERAERICLIGLRGAGKSTLGARIARDFDMAFVELNAEIEKSAGIPVAEIIALYGDEGYRQLEAETLDRISTEETRVVLAVAGGIVSDAQAFNRALERFHTVWIKAAPEEHMNRVRAQGDLRPMEGNPQAMAQLRQILKSREAHYAQAAHQLDTSGKSVEASHAELHALLIENAVARPR